MKHWSVTGEREIAEGISEIPTSPPALSNLFIQTPFSL